MPEPVKPDSPSKSRRGQARTRLARRAVVDAARTLFLERGYVATTIEAISEHSDVPTATVYRLFSSKLGILKALLDTSIAGDDQPRAVQERPEIAGLFDSVYVSFYKGIGAIAGAALCGPAAFIAEARLWQRRHGGNLVQLYPFVLSARANLRRRLPKFGGYVERAQAVARVLSAIPGVTVKPDPPQTNMMHVFLQCDPERLVEECVEIAQTERVQLFRRPVTTGVPGVAAITLAAFRLGADALTAALLYLCVVVLTSLWASRTAASRRSLRASTSAPPT